MSEPKLAKSDALEQARAEARRLAASFETVFGQPRKRTAEQHRVLEHLAKHCGDDQNSYRFNDAKDGIALIAAGIHRDGAKSVLLVIDRQLAIAAKKEQPVKPAPVVRR